MYEKVNSRSSKGVVPRDGCGTLVDVADKEKKSTNCATLGNMAKWIGNNCGAQLLRFKGKFNGMRRKSKVGNAYLRAHAAKYDVARSLILNGGGNIFNLRPMTSHFMPYGPAQEAD